jgi:hypothetical protein
MIRSNYSPKDAYMRVRVLANALQFDSDIERHHCLTADCEYFALEITDEHIRIVSDNGEPVLYPRPLFDICDCRIPPNWQFVEGKDDDYYISHQRTGFPGFYEDYFGSDGNVQAQVNAQRTLNEVLSEAFEWGEEADRRVVERDLRRLQSRQQSHR